MAYIVYNIATTRIEETYENETAAKRTRTRLNNKAGEVKFAIAPSDVYYAGIEQMVERTNLMTGKTFMESVNTPYYCSPSSESYWSA